MTRKEPKKMPVTEMAHVAGHACSGCGGPATHIYGEVYLCCGCHTGEPGGGLVGPEEARAAHDLLLSVVAVYCDGGVILKNPSEVGGTWAWCAVDAEGQIGRAHV